MNQVGLSTARFSMDDRLNVPMTGAEQRLKELSFRDIVLGAVIPDATKGSVRCEEVVGFRLEEVGSICQCACYTFAVPTSLHRGARRYPTLSRRIRHNRSSLNEAFARHLAGVRPRCSNHDYRAHRRGGYAHRDASRPMHG